MENKVSFTKLPKKTRKIYPLIIGDLVPEKKENNCFCIIQ
jgi:hypothetical protein